MTVKEPTKNGFPGTADRRILLISYNESFAGTGAP